MAIASIEEVYGDDGTYIKLTAADGYAFDNDGTVMMIGIAPTNLPKLGEQLTCGGKSVMVEDVRFINGEVWVLDEYTKVWCKRD